METEEMNQRRYIKLLGLAYLSNGYYTYRATPGRKDDETYGNTEIVERPGDEIEVRELDSTGTPDPISQDAAATRYEGGLIVIQLGDKDGVPQYACNSITSHAKITYKVLAAFLVQDDANLYLEKTKFKGTHKKRWVTYDQAEEIVRQKAVLDGIGVFEGTRCADYWQVT